MQSETEMSRLARALVEAGYRIWPLKRGTKQGARAGYKRSDPPTSADPALFRTDAYDLCVLMGPCDAAGPGKRLVGVDLDGDVPPEVIARLPPTWTAHDGRHLYYTVPADTPYLQTQGLWEGDTWAVDTRDHGGLLAMSQNGVLRCDPTADSPPLADIDPTLLRKAGPPSEPREPREAPRERLAPSEATLEHWAAFVLSDAAGGTRDRLAGGLGGWLGALGWQPEDARELGRAWLNGQHGGLLRKIERACLSYHNGDRIPGAPTLERILDVKPETELLAQARMSADDFAALLAQAPGPGPALEALVSGGAYWRGAPPERPPELDWLAPALLIGPTPRPSLLSAPPKTGKSWVFQALAACVATGRPFLGTPVRQGPVLHVDLEQGAHWVRDRYWLLGAPVDELIHIVTLPNWRLDAEDAAGLLGRAAAELGAVWIFIDNLTAATPRTDHDSATEMRALFQALAPISSHIATSIIHHTSKRANDGERHAADGSRGSGDIPGAISTELRLDRVDDARALGRLYPVNTSNRARACPLLEPTRIGLAPLSGGRLQLVSLDADIERDARQALLECLPWTGTRSAWVEQAQVRKTEGLQIIRQLLRDGVIIQENGSFTCTNSPDSNGL